ncbi:hypothetical protein QR685DRAFT_245347 [Neurospora intermedia]|uniref:Secreted protein n=1 Tax=Neurospora intermedia TaxID=5142 RepID=A0ABR3DCP6_NEUIN
MDAKSVAKSLVMVVVADAGFPSSGQSFCAASTVSITLFAVLHWSESFSSRVYLRRLKFRMLPSGLLFFFFFFFHLH